MQSSHWPGGALSYAHVRRLHHEAKGESTNRSNKHVVAISVPCTTQALVRRSKGTAPPLFISASPAPCGG